MLSVVSAFRVITSPGRLSPGDPQELSMCRPPATHHSHRQQRKLSYMPYNFASMFSALSHTCLSPYKSLCKITMPTLLWCSSQIFYSLCCTSSHETGTALPIGLASAVDGVRPCHDTTVHGAAVPSTRYAPSIGARATRCAIAAQQYSCGIPDSSMLT